MNDTPRLRIGTRGSPLARAQADAAARGLAASHPDLADGTALETVVIKTTGDTVQDRPLAEVGGKGLFTKELDEALLDGRIDIAVHSMKDVPTWLPDGIALGAVLEREDPRDAFISPVAESLDALPGGAVVGTASLRRRTQVLDRRPDLRVETFRGNVHTRLRKLEDGEAAATLLAYGGLRRLAMAHAATAALDPDVLLPACAQGTVGIACRANDTAVLERLAPLDDRASAAAVTAERAFLEVLDGSCRTPIAGLAEMAGGRVRFRGLLGAEDGSRVVRAEREGAAADAEPLGRDAGWAIRRDAPELLPGA